MSQTIENSYQENETINKNYIPELLTHEKLSALEERLEPVQNSRLIPGTAGHVNTSTGKGMYGIEFQSPFVENTYHHEFAHVLGIKSEQQADTWALYKTGKVDYYRGIGYRPPINLN